jgi:hypothetical protein
VVVGRRRRAGWPSILLTLLEYSSTNTDAAMWMLAGGGVLVGPRFYLLYKSTVVQILTLRRWMSAGGGVLVGPRFYCSTILLALLEYSSTNTDAAKAGGGAAPGRACGC